MLGAGIHLYLGEVFAPIPYLKSYLVDIKGVGRVHAVPGEEGSGSRRGSTGGSPAYLPGATVILAMAETSSEGSVAQAMPAIIITSITLFPKGLRTEFSPIEGVENLSDYNNNEMYNSIIDADYEKVLRQDRSYNSLVDSLPGDWSKANVTGGLLRLSLFLTQIGASPSCGLSFNSIDDTATLTFENLIKETSTYNEVVIGTGSAPIQVRQYAMTAKQGLGALREGVAPLEEDDDEKPQPIEDNQIGFFRQVLLDGAGAEGSYTYTQTTTSDEDINTTDNEAIAGLTAIQNRMDGIYRLRAATEVSLRKTGNIQVPIQISELLEPKIVDTEEEAEDPYDGLTYEEAKVKYFGFESEEALHEAEYIMHEDLVEFEEKYLMYKSLKETGEWKIPDSSDTQSKIADPSESQLPPVGTNPEYTYQQLESLIQEAVELLPGRKVKLWKNESAFVMASDGSLTIEDGFGCGMKTENGNLILTSAADIKLLPGRDIVSMAPGKTILKSKKSVDVVSTESAVSMKAEENMQLLSGNGGAGALILQNKATKELSFDAEVATLLGEAQGSGIFLKSNNGLGLLSSNIYAGADHSGRDNSKGLSRKSKGCNIVIDSGSGTLMTRGSYGSHLYSTSGEFGSSESSAGLTISGSHATLVGQQADIVVAALQIKKGSGSINRPEITKNGVSRANKYDLPSSDPNVLLFGDLRASGQIGAVGNIATEGRLLANQGADYLERPRQKYLNLRMPAVNAADVASNLYAIPLSVSAALEQQVIANLLSEKGHSYSDFAYPNSETMGITKDNVYFKENKWQRLLSSPGTWDENSIDHAIIGKTYPFPGKEAYEEDLEILLVKDGENVKKTSFKDYKTNT